MYCVYGYTNGFRNSQGYFLARNANKSYRYSEQDMYNELVKLADKGELDRCKIPKVQTIKEWISRYSRQVKKEAAERASENHGEVSESKKG
ncbi:10708_t:CDS:2 [Funneliformis mosseae]|uniref:10708_t:CDS:1 n=1 Tax=Funneliformis mosseae TaxID=27381 RepID=A0A9N9A5Y2_FUNMO|nr:10708_t:CDS:2 [Funneliformis mosseae]